MTNEILNNDFYAKAYEQKHREYQLSYDGVREKENLDKQLYLEDARHHHKMEQQYAKEMAKLKTTKFYTSGKETRYQVVSGDSRILKDELVANCVISSVEGYALDAIGGEKMFSFKIKSVGATVEAGPYKLKDISSANRLKATSLITYIVAPADLIHKTLIYFYDFIHKELCSADDFKILPSVPGWNIGSEKLEYFPVHNDEAEFGYSEDLKSHHRRYSSCTSKEMVEKFSSILNAFSDEACCLLIVRLVALLGRILTDSCIQLRVILIGDNSLDVARRLLANVKPATVVNLGADRIDHIRKIALKIRDTSLICMFSNTSEKTSKNHWNQMSSWYTSGYIEGSKVMIPLVVCLDKISKDLPLADFIVIKTDTLDATLFEEAFDMLSTVWIDYIRGNDLETISSLLGGKLEDSTPKGLLNQLVSVIIRGSKSFDLNEGPENVHGNYCKIMDKIQNYWSEALSSQNGDIVDEFHDKVEDLVCQRQLFFVEYRKKMIYNPEASSKDILFDDDYYYFPNDTLEYISNQSVLDDSCILKIKQNLIDLGLVKLYRNSGSHNRELQVDISVTNSETSKKENLSVFAIKREFWDELGGLTLCEKGDTRNEINV